MHRRLLLWDIDGTLLRAGPAGIESFERAVADVVGRPVAARPPTAGRTDPQIVRDYLRGMDVTADLDDTILQVLRLHEGHLRDASRAMVDGGWVCPGVVEILTRLVGDQRVLSGVLTGNTAANALTKLAAFGLDELLDLDVGAYGSDDPDRNALVPVAMTRAADERGLRLEPDDVWVIGDTPLDLACAEASGVHCLLVATGHTPVAELAPLGADALFDDLSDVDQVLKVLTADLSC